MTGPDRAQAFTLEGIIGTLILLTAVIFGLQAVDVAPFTDRSGDRIESLRVQVQDLLAATADSGALERAVTCVDATGDPALNVANPAQPVTDFGVLLNRTLVQSGHQYTATLSYRDGATLTRQPLYNPGAGTPPDGTVSATRQVLLQNHTVIHRTVDGSCVTDPGGQTVENTAGFYVDPHPAADAASPVYNVVRVRVIAW